jgi:hypothetical protein
LAVFNAFFNDKSDGKSHFSGLVGFSKRTSTTRLSYKEINKQKPGRIRETKCTDRNRKMKNVKKTKEIMKTAYLTLTTT